MNLMTVKEVRNAMKFPIRGSFGTLTNIEVTTILNSWEDIYENLGVGNPKEVVMDFALDEEDRKNVDCAVKNIHNMYIDLVITTPAILYNMRETKNRYVQDAICFADLRFNYKRRNAFLSINYIPRIGWEK